MGVKRAIHDKPKTQFKNLNISRNNTKSLMKFLHQIAIKCLAYLILNKRKLDHKHTPWPTAHGHDNTITLYNCGTMTLWSPPIYCIIANHDSWRWTASHFMPVTMITKVFFPFFLWIVTNHSLGCNLLVFFGLNNIFNINYSNFTSSLH